MNARRIGTVRAVSLAVATAATMALAGCDSGDDGGGASDPSATRISTLALGAQRVRGSGSVLAVWGQPTYSSVALRLLQQDADDPDLLLDLATILPPVTLGFDKADVSVNDQWVAVAGGFQASWVQFVETGGPYAAVGAINLFAAERATAWNDRLVAVTPTDVWLFDVTTPSSPALLDSFTLGAPSTAIAAVGTGVFVFNTTGYGYVDLVAGTYVETASLDLKMVTSATAYGGKLYVGGPSRYAGYFRVGRVDPSAAPTLTVEIANDLIPDGDTWGSNVADSAFDPVTKEWVLLEETEKWNPYEAPGNSNGDSSMVLRYAQRGAEIVRTGSATLDHVACTTQSCGMYSSDGTARIHAYGGVVYVVLVKGPYEPLYAYRLP